jgi:Zn-dependent protease/predicted transcriptional regulator
MFGRRFKLFKLFGFQVSIDLSWIFIAILVVWSLSVNVFPIQAEGLSTEAYWLMGIAGALGLFLSIVAHELSHSLVARLHGLEMSGITLFIFGGVAEMSEEAKNPQTEFLVALAGPISSGLIAALCLGIWFVGGDVLPDAVHVVVGYLGWINIVLALFNLVPAFPLDGGRVLRAVLWGARGNLRWATRVTSMLGSGFGLLLVGLGVVSVVMGNLSGIWLFLIGLFIQRAASMSYRQLVTREALAGEPLRRFMRTDPVTVRRETTIAELVEDYVYRHHHKMFPVVDDDGRLLGCVTTRQVQELDRSRWRDVTAGELASRVCADNAIAPEADTLDALAAMRRTGSSRLLVVSGDRLEGVIALKDMLEFLALKVELERG